MAHAGADSGGLPRGKGRRAVAADAAPPTPAAAPSPHREVLAVVDGKVRPHRHVPWQPLQASTEWVITALVAGILLCNLATLALPAALLVARAAEAALGVAVPAALARAAWTAWAAAVVVSGVPLVGVALVHFRLLRWRPAIWLTARLATWMSVAFLRLHAWTGRRPYWSFLDDGIVLGSMPLPSDVPKLRALGITQVINLCEEYEVRRRAGAAPDRRRLRPLTPPRASSDRVLPAAGPAGRVHGAWDEPAVPAHGGLLPADPGAAGRRRGDAAGLRQARRKGLRALQGRPGRPQTATAGRGERRSAF